MTDGEAALHRAARAVKSLRDETGPSRGFGRRVIHTVGAPLSRVRLQAGLVRAAAIVIVGALVVLAASAGLGWHASRELAKFVANMKAAAADPAAFGVTSYSGVYHQSQPGAGVDVEFAVALPDKVVCRWGGDGRSYGNDGRVYWYYDPAMGTGILNEGPLASDFAGNLAYGYTSWPVRYLERVLWGTPVGRGARGTSFTDWGTLKFGGRDTVAGRPARILILAPPGAPGPAGTDPWYSEQWYWVDEENFMVLRTAQVANEGIRFQESGFTSLQLNAVADLDTFRPAFPEGARLTLSKHGTLPELAAEVGVLVDLPEGTPSGLTAGPARLDRLPGPEPGSSGDSGLWLISWSYAGEDPLDGGQGGQLCFTVSNRAPDSGLGVDVEILPGLSGLYQASPRQSDFSSGPPAYSSLVWSKGGLTYKVEAFSLSLTFEQYLEMARSIMPGQ